MPALAPWKHPLKDVPFQAVLKQHPPGFKVVYFTPEDTVASVFQRLADANILSAPIVAPSRASVNQYVDLVDVYDLVSFVMTAFFDTSTGTSDLTNLRDFSYDPSNADSNSSTLLQRPLRDILASEGKNDDIGFISSVLSRSVQALIDRTFFASPVMGGGGGSYSYISAGHSTPVGAVAAATATATAAKSIDAGRSQDMGQPIMTAGRRGSGNAPCTAQPSGSFSGGGVSPPGVGGGSVSSLSSTPARPRPKLRYNRSHVHRVAVADPEGAVLNILSMSDIVRYIDTHPQHLEPNADVPIGSVLRVVGEELLHGPAGEASAAEGAAPAVAGHSCGGSRKPVTVSVNTPTIDALLTIQKSGLHCVVLVDDDGKVVGGLSPADLRNLTPSQIPLLARPVGEFLAESDAGFPESPAVKEGAAKPAARCARALVTADMPLKEVIHLMVTDKQHYAIGVDGDGKPLFVVTLTDILRLFVSKS